MSLLERVLVAAEFCVGKIRETQLDTLGGTAGISRAKVARIFMLNSIVFEREHPQGHQRWQLRLGRVGLTACFTPPVLSPPFVESDSRCGYRKRGGIPFHLRRILGHDVS